MTCDDVEPLADAYVDGELDLERALAVEAHVAGCAACTARLERTRALARTLKTAPYFRAPEALSERLRATTAAAAATTSSQPGATRPPAPIMAIAHISRERRGRVAGDRRGAVPQRGHR